MCGRDVNIEISETYQTGIFFSALKKEKDNFCYLSKYWEKTWFALSEKEAIDILRREFMNEYVKPVIVLRLTVWLMNWISALTN